MATLFQRLSKTSPRVNIVRAFEDGQAVEHWDNIQQRRGPNQSGHTMVDGPTEAVDLELTESNRAFVRSFVDTVLIDGQLDQLTDFIDEKTFTDHNPRLGDDVSLLRSALALDDESGSRIRYETASIVFLPREASYSVSARATIVATVLPFMIYFASQIASWWSIGIPPKK